MLTTLGILILSAVVEGLFSGKEAKRQLAQLRQPKWGPNFLTWTLIGLFYYLIFGAILYRAVTAGAVLHVGLVTSILLLNGFWNYLFFRRQSLEASLLLLFPYAAIVGALFLLLSEDDPASAFILMPYLVYLPFVILWTRSLARLNRNSTA